MTMWTLRSSTLGVVLALLWGCDASYRRHHHDNVSSTVVGSGHLATESRPVHGFTAVEVTAAGHLIVEQTGLESLEVTAEDNVLPLVRSEVRNSRLVLGFEPGASVTVTREVLFHLTVRELTAVDASGASRVEIRGVDTTGLTLRVSGASDVSATGRAGRTELDLSGASRSEAPDLQNRELTANLSRASYALVRASDSLVVSASGASILEYLGDPDLVANVSDGSVVRRAGP
jgi:hypothetical protein